MMRWLCLLPLLLFGSLAWGRQITWFAVYLDGQQVGHMQWQRQRFGELVETRSELSIGLLRGEQPMPVLSHESSLETDRGEPRGFSSRFEAGGSSASVHAKVDPLGHVVAEVQTDQQHQTVRFQWPQQALLAEGQRLELLRLLQSGQRHWRGRGFEPASMQALDLAIELRGRRQVELEDGRAELWQVRHSLGRGDSAVEVDSWVDPTDATARQLRIPALGLELELRACSESCAKAPYQAADVFASTLVAAPRSLGVRERRLALAFDLELRRGRGELLAAVPGQTILSQQGARVTLRVAARGGAEMPPQADDLAANRWLQSTHPEIQRFAQQAVGRSRDSGRRMGRLERAVRAALATKSLRVGYASALEALQRGEGDCTEHAVLLAAAARALGIPARVVTGLAYAPRFGTRNDVFVPHAWVIAWTGKRWQGFDAALPRFDSGHIGLTAGSGDPFDFYAGVELLGNIAITAVRPAPPLPADLAVDAASQRRWAPGQP